MASATTRSNRPFGLGEVYAELQARQAADAPAVTFSMATKAEHQAPRSTWTTRFNGPVRQYQPSENQKQFIKDMLTEIAKSNRDYAVAQWNTLRAEQRNGTMTRELISNTIDTLKGMRDKYREENRQAAAVTVVVPEVPNGYYAIEREPQAGRNEVGFFRVSHGKDGKGRIKVQRKVSNSLELVGFAEKVSVLTEIAKDPGAARMLFATELERCWNCGKDLTKDASRHLGLGQKCAAKLGLA